MATQFKSLSRNLLVRVADYSDYFVDLDKEPQEKRINRMEQELG